MTVKQNNTLQGANPLFVSLIDNTDIISLPYALQSFASVLGFSAIPLAGTNGSKNPTWSIPVTASFTAHVYLDTNANGIESADDADLAGITVYLLNGNGSATGKTAITDAKGNVSFAGLAPAAYEISFLTPVDYRVAQRSNVLTPITLSAGSSVKAIEGLYASGTFTTHVYTDINANGRQDVSDGNLAGATITLLKGNGVATGKTAVTDANGNVKFTGLPPGSYKVSVTAPPGYAVTQKTNVSSSMTVASGITAAAVEGLYAPVTFLTHVYTDVNGNGTQDDGDASLAGIIVRLLKGNGAETGKTAVTDAAGNARFTGLLPGSYQVSVADPIGYVPMQADSVLQPIALTSGGVANAVRGIYAPGTITAHIYTDTNANGTQDSGDTNLAGVMVSLLNRDGGVIGLPVATDVDGNARFTGLVPGEYRISVAAPTGDMVAQQTNVLTPIALGSGSSVSAIEGMYAPGTITAHVYTDANANGVQDNGDPNRSGVMVSLLNGNGSFIGTPVATDADGNVSFAGLTPGRYEVSVTDVTGDAVTQQTNVLTPIVLASGGSVAAMAGVYDFATINAHVYTDANANGVQDNGDTNLPGMMVSLMDEDGTAFSAPVAADANGNVTFTGLVPGKYEVSVVTPTGQAITQETNVLTQITLTSGASVAAIVGLAATLHAATPVTAAPVAGANSDVGLIAVGAPVYAAGSRVLTVGVDKTYQTIASAIGASHDGDVILVDGGTYTDDFAVVSTKISLIAVGGRVTMNATVPPPNYKGILTEETDLTVIGFDFTNSRIPDDQGHNGAGIRVDNGNLVLINDSFTGNQDGLLTNGGNSISVTIDHSLFNDNGGADGNGAGNIHNVYLGNIAFAKVTNSVFENAQVGHEFKSRAVVNTLTNNVFISGVGIGTGSYDIDLPNGGTDVLTNNTIIKGPNAENPNMVHFGGEGIPYAGSSLSVVGNLFRSRTRMLLAC